jgi:hypothetical protein
VQTASHTGKTACVGTRTKIRLQAPCTVQLAHVQDMAAGISFIHLSAVLCHCAKLLMDSAGGCRVQGERLSDRSHIYLSWNMHCQVPMTLSQPQPDAI